MTPPPLDDDAIKPLDDDTLDALAREVALAELQRAVFGCVDLWRLIWTGPDQFTITAEKVRAIEAFDRGLEEARAIAAASRRGIAKAQLDALADLARIPRDRPGPRRP